VALKQITGMVAQGEAHEWIILDTSRPSKEFLESMRARPTFQEVASQLPIRSHAGNSERAATWVDAKGITMLAADGRFGGSLRSHFV
jgi:hypothetical protein